MRPRRSFVALAVLLAALFAFVAAGAAALPTAVTGAATNVTDASATLNGTVNPGGEDTTYHFEYGTTTSYGRSTDEAGAGAGDQDVSVSAPASGLDPATTYHYRLVATNNSGTIPGDDATFTTQTPPNQPPTARLSADPTSGIAPLTVTFDGADSSDSDGRITAWRIESGDGAYATGSGSPPRAIQHTYTSPGTYTAKLYVRDDQDSTDSTTLTVTVNANQPPTAQLSAQPSAGTAPLQVSFDGSTSSDSDGTIAGWRLAFGDGSPDLTGNGAPPSTIEHTYGSPNTYTATLTVADDRGATGNATVQIKVGTDQAPTARLTASPVSGTAPLRVTFDGSRSSDPDDGITGWSLNFGDSSSASGNGKPPRSATHTYSSPGTYTATLTVADGHGVHSSGAVQITVNGPPGPTARTDAPSGIGETQATLNGTGNAKGQASFASFEYGKTTGYGATTEQLYLGNDKNDYSVSASVSGLTPGTTYHYRLVVKNQAGTTSYGSDKTFDTKGASPSSTDPTSPPKSPESPVVRKFELRDTSVTATRGRVVILHIACPASAKGSCRGGVALKALLKGKGHLANGRPNVKRQLIGSGRFTILHGAVAPVRVKLTAKGFRLLVRARKLRVEATVIAYDKGGGVVGNAWSIKPIIAVKAPGA